MLVWSRTITGRVHWEAINKLVKIHALNSLNIKAWLGLIFLAIAMGPLAFCSRDGSILAGLDLSGRLFWGRHC